MHADGDRGRQSQSSARLSASLVRLVNDNASCHTQTLLPHIAIRAAQHSAAIGLELRCKSNLCVQKRAVLAPACQSYTGVGRIATTQLAAFIGTVMAFCAS